MKNTFPFKIDKKNNSLILNINLSIYEKDAAMKAAYVFADKFDVFFDAPSKKKLQVILKAKDDSAHSINSGQADSPQVKFTEKDAGEIAGEFYNQILNATIRKKVSAGNKKLIESVLAGTIISSLESNNPDRKKFMESVSRKTEEKPLKNKIEKEIEELEKEIEKTVKKGGYKKDPLGIRKVRK